MGSETFFAGTGLGFAIFFLGLSGAAAHGAAVRDATLDTAAALVAAHGLRSVTMSAIAGETGIGRATLYKYYADVEAILVAWHERQINAHLAQLAALRDRIHDPAARLRGVLEAHALISHESRSHRHTDVAAFLHGDAHVARARQHLEAFVSDLLNEAAAAGAVRTDVPADELAGFCLHALDAASGLPSKAAVRRLVTVTLAGVRPDA